MWHLEPSLADPDTVYAGVEDAALFRSDDGGSTWRELPGLREAKGHLWQPGAGGMGLHTIVLDPNDAKRIFVAISAAGVFRSTTAGRRGSLQCGCARIRTAGPGRRGRPLCPQYPITVRAGRALHAEDWDVMRSDDAGELHEVSGNAHDFGFPLRCTPTSRIRSTSCPSRATRALSAGRQAARPQPHRRQRVEALTEGLPQSDCWSTFCDAMAVDTLAACGVYFGTPAAGHEPPTPAIPGRLSCAICRLCCRWRSDAAMIRATIPSICERRSRQGRSASG